MSPTVMFDANGEVKLGGSRIIGHTAQSIFNVIEFKLDPQEAIDTPHYQNNNEESTSIETPIPGVTRDFNGTDLAESPMARGHEVNEAEMNSGGLSMNLLEDSVLVGVVD